MQVYLLCPSCTSFLCGEEGKHISLCIMYHQCRIQLQRDEGAWPLRSCATALPSQACPPEPWKATREETWLLRRVDVASSTANLSLLYLLSGHSNPQQATVGLAPSWSDPMLIHLPAYPLLYQSLRHQGQEWIGG